MGCRDNPYEEGTESIVSRRYNKRISFVAEIIPMKRELKVFLSQVKGIIGFPVAEIIPMKRELKVIFSAGKPITNLVAEIIPMKRELKVSLLETVFPHFEHVAEIIPMKRELKDF